MREFDAFSLYPQPAKPRTVSAERSAINQRIIASYRGASFYDGARDSGYGGLKYDGRWKPVADYIAKEYKLGSVSSVYGRAEDSHVLQIGCEKGFLLADLQALGLRVAGTDVSHYAVAAAPASIAKFITCARPTEQPYADGTFDFVICAGPVYSLTLEDAIACIKEIQRVGKGKSFITLGAYDTQEDYWLFRAWTLLGCTILSREDWLEVLEHCEYTGDYKFNTAESLGLQWT